MNNRVTWGLRETADDSWTVVHEHSSGPTDFETGTVQLQRPTTG